jgi:hypothetical protein
LPPIDRVLGALPTLHYNDIMIPDLAADLDRVAMAGRLGLLRRTHPFLTILIAVAVVLLLLTLVAWRLLWRRHHKNAQLT